MSSLWRNDKKLLTNLKSPSSEHKTINLFTGPVRAKRIFSPQPPYYIQTGFFIEGTSLSAFLKRGLSASMTVEAAIVLPLFLFFFVNLSCAIEMLRLHGNLQLALWHTGTQMSIYGHVLTDSEKSRSVLLEELGDITFSYGYVKREIVKYAGERYLEESPLIHGADSLQFLESEIFTSENHFQIVMTYGVSPWIQMEGVRTFRMANKYYGHLWNGYQIPGTENPDAEAMKTVYMTENGQVYHEDRNCTHLRLTIREVPASGVDRERNQNGGKYTLCEKCGAGLEPQNVYIGVEGDRYHYDSNCSGLTRTVYAVLMAEAEQYRPCSRCSQ